MNPLFRGVYALALSIIGLAAVVLAIQEAAESTSHEFLDYVQPAMDVAVPAVVMVVLVIGAIAVIVLVRWAISTASPGGGR